MDCNICVRGTKRTPLSLCENYGAGVRSLKVSRYLVYIFISTKSPIEF